MRLTDDESILLSSSNDESSDTELEDSAILSEEEQLLKTRTATRKVCKKVAPSGFAVVFIPMSFAGRKHCYTRSARFLEGNGDESPRL